ncbi:hypothetical protein M378DRAFT_170475 [Amanita muscaria Koide BX008]|uniref:Uncharacterized protein n=1 Tax=Amanita muscaria (strain Koide BX008) TaxID=946122 RepID=A0A0C2SWT7_AMAMK|nr:hypothetical protein M378DRAFT_170475 [Amanita muscaria Koide BX008]
MNGNGVVTTLQHNGTSEDYANSCNDALSRLCRSHTKARGWKAQGAQSTEHSAMTHCPVPADTPGHMLNFCTPY